MNNDENKEIIFQYDLLRITSGTVSNQTSSLGINFSFVEFVMLIGTSFCIKRRQTP